MDGEIKSSTRTDKSITRIKYRQAECENLKTSIRVGYAITEKVKNGQWRGGNFSYGYKGIYKRKLNFKGKTIIDVEIIPERAERCRKQERYKCENQF